MERSPSAIFTSTMPTKVLLILFAVLPLLRVSSTAKSGEFFLVVESVDNHPEMSRDIIDWHFSLRRINKTVKLVDGHFTVNTPIVRPKMRGETFLFTMNKFVKININGPVQCSCEELTGSFFETYFEGNVTWTDDCIIQPGHMTTRKDTPINLDKIAHTMYTKTFYRTFKFTATMFIEDDKPIMKISWVVSTKAKE